MLEPGLGTVGRLRREGHKEAAAAVCACVAALLVCATGGASTPRSREQAGREADAAFAAVSGASCSSGSIRKADGVAAGGCDGASHGDGAVLRQRCGGDNADARTARARTETRMVNR